jgi:single-strand DNA-binding protein
MMGNLTRAPELKYTKNNVPFCRVGVALNRSYKDKQGEWVEAVTFTDVVFWGKLAERVGQIPKGDPVYIEGRLETNSWETDTGEKRSRLEVVGSAFRQLGRIPKQEPSEVPPDDDEGEKIADEVDKGLKEEEAKAETSKKKVEEPKF